MTPIVLNVSEDEARSIMQRAQEAGYETVEAYLRALIDLDMEADDDAASLQADFKEAFKDAVRGISYTREEFKRLMKEDD